MRVRLLLAAILTTMAPGLAFATCSGHDEVTMSCPAGQTFDAETSTCKPLPTT